MEPYNNTRVEEFSDTGHIPLAQDSGVGIGMPPDDVSKEGEKQKEGEEQASLPGCAIALITWFCEHIGFEKYEDCSGRIPRYLSWKFHQSSKRKFLRNHLELVPISGVKPDPLKATPAEMEFVGKGFNASHHVLTISNEDAISAYQFSSLASLLVQLAPVYMLFKFPVCKCIATQVKQKWSEQLKSNNEPSAVIEVNKGCKSIKPATEIVEEPSVEGSEGCKSISPAAEIVQDIIAVPFDSITPYFGKFAPDSKKLPKARITNATDVPTFSLGFASPNTTVVSGNKERGEASVEITGTTIANLKPHEILVESVDYATFKMLLVDADNETQDYIFKWKSEGKSFHKSIFDDPFESPLANAVGYMVSDSITEEMSLLLDTWFSSYKKGNIPKNELVYDNNKFSALALHLADLLSNRGISCDVVGCILDLIQRDTPVTNPWFFIRPYTATVLHHTSYAQLYATHPFLFRDEFMKSKYILIPLVGNNHWVLLSGNMHEKSITMFNSLARSLRNKDYEHIHRMAIAWFRNFMVWRTDQQEWATVGIKWAPKIPKQENGVDCGLYLIRYVHFIVTEQTMKVTKMEIKKDRSVLTYKLLSSVGNGA